MDKESERRRLTWMFWIALALILWRLGAGKPKEYWKDWMLIGSLFWIYTEFKGASPGWPVAAVTTAAFLLSIYLLGQIPHALAAVGIGY